MKIIVIGASGTIGKVVADEWEDRHDIVRAGRSGGDVRVDIADSDSIQKMFEDIGEVDAVVCVAGEAKWDDFSNLSEEDFYIGIKSKMMGQVNLVRYAAKYLNRNGSVTLTTGILADDPVKKTTSAAMVNGAIHSFVKAVALEMERGIRVNVVAAGLVELSAEKYRGYFPGHNPVPMGRVVNGYVRSVEGARSGEVISVI
jgi:NAD(P)-dependent dehydrogenase (short-subunit alcohol dehydrogenase family)